MFMIKYVTPEKAEGSVKAIYDIFPEEVGVPHPLQLYSASPVYLKKQMGIAKHYMSNDNFEPAFLAALRFVGASTTCFGYCTEFNKGMLKSLGLSDTEIETLGSTPTDSFGEKEAALIAFTAKAIRAPDTVIKADIDRVRDTGWTDQEIFEATTYTAQMSTIGIVFRAFAKK